MENRTPSKKMAIFGALVLIFAVIGLVSTITMATKGIGNLMDNTRQKDELE